jgi:spore germination cell wall hydrolase CwlJ-like protein
MGPRPCETGGDRGCGCRIRGISRPHKDETELNRIVRAAGLAAATVALAAAATISAPSFAGETRPAAAVHLPAPDEAGLADVDRALDGVEAEVAPSPAEQPGLFERLWLSAKALIGGEKAPATAAPRSLDQLVAAHAAIDTADAEQDCLANAVYFEARGEPIEGQLAVAEVVLNRAASGRYPADLCQVVRQPWQFSFVRRGRFPHADKASAAWRKAVAIAKIAQRQLADTLPADVLWYHATYVAPGWGKRLQRQAQIGLHIFYS